jgi:prevent-host-death family protein
MKKVSESRIAAKFSDYLDASQDQPVLVTRGGRPVAVLVAVNNESQARRVAAKPIRTLRSIFQEATEQLNRGEGVPIERFRQELGEMRKAEKPTSRKTKRTSKRAPAKSR